MEKKFSARLDNVTYKCIGKKTSLTRCLQYLYFKYGIELWQIDDKRHAPGAVHPGVLLADFH